MGCQERCTKKLAIDDDNLDYGAIGIFTWWRYFTLSFDDALSKESTFSVCDEGIRLTIFGFNKESKSMLPQHCRHFQNANWIPNNLDITRAASLCGGLSILLLCLYSRRFCSRFRRSSGHFMNMGVICSLSLRSTCCAWKCLMHALLVSANHTMILYADDTVSKITPSNLTIVPSTRYHHLWI